MSEKYPIIMGCEDEAYMQASLEAGRTLGDHFHKIKQKLFEQVEEA